jgi:hypothetical protein
VLAHYLLEPAAPRIGDTKKGQVFTETGWVSTKRPWRQRPVVKALAGRRSPA